MSKLEAALSLAAHGYRVFPLAINGKTPAFSGDWRQIATTDPAKIHRLWRDPLFDIEVDYNIGIALNRETLVVDVDIRDGKRGEKSLALLEAINDEIPPTYTVTTASGGEHRYFKVADSGCFPKQLADHIDLKGEGGYVVGPGSSIGERSYTAYGEGAGADVADAPGWLCDFADHKRAAPRDRVATAAALGDVDSESAIARAAEWLERSAPDAVEGDGGDLTTLKVAARVKDFGISQARCAELMDEHWNEQKAHPPWDFDELGVKVANAYRYGKDPIGVSNPEAEFEDTTAGKPPEEKPRGKLFWKRFEHASPAQVTDELIEGWIDTGAMSVWYGNSNVGKTFVMLSAAHAIGSGQPWAGYKVAPGLVVYVAAEGGHSIETRLMALRQTAGEARLAYIPCPVDLLHENADTKPLVRLIREIEAAYGEPPRLIVIDTLSRALAGGNENASDDMGALVKNLDAIRAAFKAHVAIVHHKGKNEAAGARGHSLLRAATDTEVEVASGKIVATKQRDKEAAPELAFRLASVEVAKRADGAPLRSCVVEFVSAAEFEEKMSPAYERSYRALWEAVAKAVKMKKAWISEQLNSDKPDVPDVMRCHGLSWSEAWERVRKTGRGEGLTRSTVYDHFDALSGNVRIRYGVDKTVFLT